VSPPIHPLTSSQEAVFLVNSRQRNFSCGSSKTRAGLIPKVRPLFCRVPWGTFTRSPWATRPAHLCRFSVRVIVCWCLGAFLETVLYIVPPSELGFQMMLGFGGRAPSAPDLPGTHPYTFSPEPFIGDIYYNPSLHRTHDKLLNINSMSIEYGVCHLLRTRLTLR
jgi:hypothetical protein